MMTTTTMMMMTEFAFAGSLTKYNRGLPHFVIIFINLTYVLGACLSVHFST